MTAPTDTTADYWELEAELSPEGEELWGVFCYEQGATGAELVEDSGPRRVVRHVFDAPPPAADLARAFAQAYPGVAPPYRATLRRRPREAWETAWRAHFTPLALGRRLLVTPPWAPAEAAAAPHEAASAGARLRVVIDPGQGFGTGWHPSTALAAEALEATLDALPAPPARLLDVGTGSGILAIAGRLLGVPEAVAIDVDRVALPEVRHNAALSGVQPLPAVVQGRPDCLRGAFPLVVANIVSEVLLAARDALAGLTAPGGYLILSGILESERAALEAAYAAAGLRLGHAQQREGWCALRLHRP